VIASVAAFSALLVDWLAVRHGSVDVQVYHAAVNSWVRKGDLYGYRFPKRHLRFTYPPFAAVCMVPMLLFPISVVIRINQLVIAAAIFVSTRCVVVRLPMLARHGTWFVTAVIVPVVCVLQPVRDTLTLGQVNITLVALVLVDLVLLERGSRFAGVGVGLATAVKLTPGLFIVFLFVAGLRRAAGTAVAAFGTATLFAAALAPGTSSTFWFSTLFDVGRVGSYDSATNQSLGGLLTRLTNSSHLPGYWLPIVVLISVWSMRTAAQLWRSGAHLPAFTVVGLAATLVSPISWVHHLWWVVPGLLILIDAALRKGSTVLMMSAVTVAVLLASGLPDLTRAAAGHHLAVSAIIGENAYVVVSLGLLLLIPRMHLTTTHAT
jgi:alpha-1,2-mannosyltransferase